MRSYLELPTDIRTNNGSIVGMAYHCLGLGVMSFWIAFIITAASKLKRKILWGLGGIAAIWLINCFRVTFLLMSLDYNWKDNSYLDHHSMFNLAAYSLILIMVYLYTSKNEKQALIIN
jgi:exosortase/archaeosortase family protein